MARITVIGSGYVGLVYCAAFAEFGNDVWGVDINAEKVARLQAGECPIFEPGLPEMLQRNLAAGRLRFTTDYAVAVPDAEFIFICVDTPSAASGEADMRSVRAAAATIARHLAGDTIVINKSTMPVGSGDIVSAIIGEHIQPGATYHVVSNAEFLREGCAVFDVFNPDRVIIGAEDAGVAARVAALFDHLDAPIVITDRRSGEMIKYASNAFLAAKISFINEVAQVCEAIGADVTAVAHGMGLDGRIGSRFLEAGVGYGGSCFPKDVKALEYTAREAGCEPRMLRATMEVNASLRERFVRKVEALAGGVRGKRVAVWGLAFKQDTDDMRESPSTDIIRMLEQRGATVTAYDPVAAENARELLPNTTLSANPYDAVRGADVLCVLTPWSEFRQLDFARVRALMRAPLIVDGRNLYDPDEMARHGFKYASIGRVSSELPAVALNVASVPTQLHAEYSRQQAAAD